MPDPSAYTRRCAETCKWCAKGIDLALPRESVITFSDGKIYHCAGNHSREMPVCTAPTIEQDYERLAARVVELEAALKAAYRLPRPWMHGTALDFASEIAYIEQLDKPKPTQSIDAAIDKG